MSVMGIRLMFVVLCVLCMQGCEGRDVGNVKVAYEDFYTEMLNSNYRTAYLQMSQSYRELFSQEEFEEDFARIFRIAAVGLDKSCIVSFSSGIAQIRPSKNSMYSFCLVREGSEWRMDGRMGTDMPFWD